MCGRFDEDGGHLLLKCKEVKEVWRELSLEEIRCDLANASSAREMMEKILKLDAQQQAQVVMLLWLWWKRETNGERKGEGELAEMWRTWWLPGLTI